MYSSKYRYNRLSPEERERILETIREVLEKRGVKLAVVFSSFVELESFRDIDVAVYTGISELDLNTLLDISVELEERLQIPVDVVPLEYVSAKFKYYILTKGSVILESQPGLYEALLMQTFDELLVLEGERAVK